MRLKLIPKLVFAALLFVAAAWPTQAQVSPSATKGGIPILVGAGFSNFGFPDWGPGVRMDGITAWLDFYPRSLPWKLQGLGIEAEGRDLNFGRPTNFTQLRHDTALVGPIYAWDRYVKFHPYAKFLAGIGSVDFPPMGVGYSHDTFTTTAPGGGVEYRIWQSVWVRGDYEYQFWHHAFGPNDFNPQGFTIGASYDFRRSDEE